MGSPAAIALPVQLFVCLKGRVTGRQARRMRKRGKFIQLTAVTLLQLIPHSIHCEPEPFLHPSPEQHVVLNTQQAISNLKALRNLVLHRMCVQSGTLCMSGRKRYFCDCSRRASTKAGQD